LVDRVLKAFRENASLAIRFQKAEREYQRKILGLPSAAPWDVDASPKSLQPPLHTIGDASKAVLTATSIFGAEYQKEMEHLLDPKNGRMDIVPAPNREDGDFTTGSYGPGWVFFMHGYDGQTNQVVTLAHEAAHAVHYRLLFNSGVPYYYSDGARYFVEGCAKVNELLILETLAKQAANDAERLYYKRQIASKLASVRFTSMYWSAFATSFEREVVKRIKAGHLTSAEQIHDVWGEFGRLWSIDFEEYPELKYTWPDTHHFLTSSRRYAQYLFAWVVALAFYEKAQSDPSAGEHFIALMKRGFSGEAAVLLENEMAIVLDDPALIERMFKVVETRVADFEKAAATGG
jgi:oligoendopeptidase F